MQQLTLPLELPITLKNFKNPHFSIAEIKKMLLEQLISADFSEEGFKSQE